MNPLPSLLLSVTWSDYDTFKSITATDTSLTHIKMSVI